jgi:hypothetical protein
MTVPPPLPADPLHPSRPTQTPILVQEVALAGGDVEAVLIMLTLLLAPLNLRYLLAILDNLRRLTRLYPALFSKLSEVQRRALELTLASYNAVASVRNHELLRDLMMSPRASKIGNLRYATIRHPLFSLLMQEHPHSATAGFFDLLVAAVTAKALALRQHFSWTPYATYINPVSRADAHCPQPLNGSLENIERAARAVTGASGADPLAVLAENPDNEDVDKILSTLLAQAKKNAYSKEAVAFARLVRSFLKATVPEEDSSSGGRGRRGYRESLNYGTLRIGALEATTTDVAGVDVIEIVPKSLVELAEAHDLAVGELQLQPQFLVDLDAGGALPPTARNTLSRYRINQLARAQQLMPTSPYALRGPTLAATNRLLARQDLPPRVALLLRASLATGRSVEALTEIHLTSGASVDAAAEDLEFDVVRGTWRIKVNQPSLRKTAAPRGARHTSSHGDLPDFFGVYAIAQACHAAAKERAERVRIRWTPAELEEALRALRGERGSRLTPEFLGRALPLAVYQQTGDLATGALVSRWLPNGSATLLHYLTVDRTALAIRYGQGADWLRRKLHLPEASVTPVEPGAVGMRNCPDDATVRILVRELIQELETHSVRNSEDRISYVNLLSTYTLLYMTQGLGLRNAIDPDPNVQIMPDGLGLAIFSDKRVSDAHERVIYCPVDLAQHIRGIASLTARLRDDFPAACGSDSPGLLPYIETDGRMRCYHPSDVRRVLGIDRFDFEPNALRRRARSVMYAYQGPDAAGLGHGFSGWMGHWTFATNPHRPEAGGLRNVIHRVVAEVITPQLVADGWRTVVPRI